MAWRTVLQATTVAPRWLDLREHCALEGHLISSVQDCVMRDTTLFGRKRGLLLVLAFGCVGAILLVAIAYRLYAPSVDEVSSDDEVYEVYSTAIKELFLKGGGAELSTTLVVVKDQSVSYRWEGWNEPTKRTQ